MKIRPKEDTLLRVKGRTGRQTDRQLDMTKLTVAFRKITKSQ